MFTKEKTMLTLFPTVLAHYLLAGFFWFGVTVVLPVILLPVGLGVVVMLLVLTAFSFSCKWYNVFTVEYLNQEIRRLEDLYIEETLKNDVTHIEKELTVSLGKGKTISVQLHVLHSKNLREDAQSIFLVHGTAGSSLSFIHLIDVLATSFNVYAIDLPGFGRSHVDKKYGCIANEYENAADFYCFVIEEFMKSANISRTVLCGHSFGGYLCMRYCKLFPSRVDGLVLLNPAGILPTLGSLGVYWACVFKFSLPNIGRYLGRFGLASMAYLFRESSEARYWYYLSAHPQGFGDRFVRDNIDLRFFHAYWNKPVFDHFDVIGCPVFLVYGEDDTIMPPHQGMLIRLIHSCELMIVKNAAHNPVASKENGKLVGQELVRYFANQNYLQNINSSLPETETEKNKIDSISYKSSFSVTKTISVIEKLYADVGKKNGIAVDIDV